MKYLLPQLATARPSNHEPDELTGGAKLAAWILKRSPGITHLKLQKLVFYCFGAASALGFEDEVGPIEFEAWEHGPVCREVWNEYRHSGRSPIDAPAEAVAGYSPEAEQVLRDALTVYGSLDAWSLRQETHLEQPWTEAWAKKQTSIDGTRLRQHFVAKLQKHVRPPQYLSHDWNFTIDGLPSATFASLHELASAIQRAK